MESERRRHKRHEICHPINIRIVDPVWIKSGVRVAYRGFIKDLSIGGMCLYLDEGYESLNIDNLLGKRIKIALTNPFVNEGYSYLGQVRWGIREGQTKSVVKIGIEFVEMTASHLKSIEQLLVIDAKDHNMLWELWDNLRMNE